VDHENDINERDILIDDLNNEDYFKNEIKPNQPFFSQTDNNIQSLL
jgi:hypothetical protein